MTKQPIDNLSKTFRSRKENNEERHKEKKGKTSQKYYGIETGNRYVKRFKLLFKSGKEVSIPYAYLPVITLTSEKQLVISTHDLVITVNGIGLYKLCDWLNEEKVLWIKESNTEINSEDYDVFVSDISIEGEWLH